MCISINFTRSILISRSVTPGTPSEASHQCPRIEAVALIRFGLVFLYMTLSSNILSHLLSTFARILSLSTRCLWAYRQANDWNMPPCFSHFRWSYFYTIIHLLLLFVSLIMNAVWPSIVFRQMLVARSILIRCRRPMGLPRPRQRIWISRDSSSSFKRMISSRVWSHEPQPP